MNIQNYFERDARLDVLRGIGILCIILAHVEPPISIMQIRSFDVPLMVLVSGASFYTSRKKSEEYGRYLYERFIRLVIPTWIFLSFFFCFSLGMSLLVNRPFPFSMENVLSSFTLMGGIGYVWVIRVFVLVAIIVPLAKKELSGNHKIQLWLILGFCYLSYEIAARHLSFPHNEWLNVIFKEIILYAIPYGLIAVVGMTIFRINPQKRLLLALLLLLIFFLIAIWFYLTKGCFITSNQYKYPPTIYYLSYAIGTSLLVSCISESLRIRSSLIGQKLTWIGRRTMWTYLWHIFILYIIKWVHFKSGFLIMYSVVVASAIIIVVIQERALEFALAKVGEEKTRRRIAIIFRG